MQKFNNLTLSKSAIFGAIEFAINKDIENRDIQILDRRFFSSDMKEGKKLVNLLGPKIFINLDSQETDEKYILTLQEILKKFIFLYKPSYLYALTHGLDEFKNSLSEDEYQCFYDAGLMEEQNLENKNIYNWWDDIEKLAWEENKKDNLETGRKGEEKTLEFETNRLKKSKIKKKPLWKARDSNRLGYDILSYSKNKGNIFEIYIESKCTTNKNGYFFLTEGEWRKASQTQDKFYVYHWYLNGNLPRIIEYNELKKHIPVNRGKGIWKDIIVQISPI